MTDAVNDNANILPLRAPSAVTQGFQQSQQWRLAWEQAFTANTTVAAANELGAGVWQSPPAAVAPPVAAPVADAGVATTEDVARQYGDALQSVLQTKTVQLHELPVTTEAARPAETGAQRALSAAAPPASLTPLLQAARGASAAPLPPPLPRPAAAVEPRVMHVFMTGEAVDVVIRDVRLQGEQLRSVVARLQSMLGELGLQTGRVIVNGALAWAAPQRPAVAQPDYERVIEINL